VAVVVVIAITVNTVQIAEAGYASSRICVVADAVVVCVAQAGDGLKDDRVQVGEVNIIRVARLEQGEEAADGRFLCGRLTLLQMRDTERAGESILEEIVHLFII
jgi:hypothetical protein